MCTLRDDYIRISYRLGQNNRPPPGGKRIPFGIFVLVGAGSCGIHVEYELKIVSGAAVIDGGATVFSGKIFAPTGGYQVSHDPNFGMRASALDKASVCRIHHFSLPQAPSEEMELGGYEAEQKVVAELSLRWEPNKSVFDSQTPVDELFLTDSLSAPLEMVFPIKLKR